jgi:hypothetical protein
MKVEKQKQPKQEVEMIVREALVLLKSRLQGGEIMYRHRRPQPQDALEQMKNHLNSMLPPWKK